MSFHADPTLAKHFDATIRDDRARCELILVEGDSAAKTVLQARSKALQGVLTLQGKPLNAWRTTEAKALAYPFYQRLIEAFGGGIGTAFDASAARYGRLVILTDPDADGIHCGALLLMFVKRFMPTLIAEGKVTVIRPPIGEVINNETGEVRWVLTESEFAKSLRSGQTQGDTLTTRRYRGLAGMSSQTISTCCLEPATRRSEPVTEADVQVVINLLG